MYIYVHFCHSNKNMTYDLGNYWFDLITAWKVSKYGVFSGPYFPVFGLNTEKYGPEKTAYLDTFHAAYGSSYHIVLAYLMSDKFHLFYKNKLWHHQELVWMMRTHSSPSRETAWKLTIFTRKPILHTLKSSLVIRTNHEHHITFVIHVSRLTERENHSPLVYPWFGELLLVTTMIAISL